MRDRGEGRYKDIKRVGRAITAIGREAGATVNSKGKPASAHDLRRSFGERLADAGVPPRELQSIMRHSRLETTERYYLRHNAAEQGKRLAAQLSGYANGNRTQISEDRQSSQVIGQQEGG
jgi:integrase